MGTTIFAPSELDGFLLSLVIHDPPKKIVRQFEWPRIATKKEFIDGGGRNPWGFLSLESGAFYAGITKTI